ncbi:hypothetical protein AVEN_198497-1 [Araneus ventricosus]|uniref:Uncharacterized protein n=1 Tax=Araneus ventricosus TaxID=182803 RepID=A0A4Y2JNG4_ARAVE|nr:hypothetical protein AVEN_198497-1 [Araneus ventricosus]
MMLFLIANFPVHSRKTFCNRRNILLIFRPNLGVAWSAPNPCNDPDIEEENIDSAPNPSHDPDIEISEEKIVGCVPNPFVDLDIEIIQVRNVCSCSF